VLSAEALRVAQGAKGYLVKSSKAEVAISITAEEQDRQIAQHGVSNFVKSASWFEADHSHDAGITMIKIGKIKIPTDEMGRVWIYPTREASQRTIPAWKILDPKFDPSTVAGCILFVGTSAEGLKDLRATALNPSAAGVEVHANIVEQALLERFLNRPYWAVYIERWMMIFFGIVITLFLSRFGALWCLPITLAAVGVCIGGPWYAFTRRSLLIDPIFPTLATLAIYMASSLIGYLKTELARRQVKGAFSRYMSPALVDQLAKHPEKLKLGGELREMTWHFCDIRGFTTISEQFDPHGLTQFINKFLTPMTEIILKHQGVIDKYMGDCIMAFWNAPLDDADHARHACQAALEMHARLAELNAQWEAEAKAENRKFIPIHIGTGLNTGTCVVGNMGSDQRFDYSVLGDGVNLASRLEGQSKSYGVNIVIGPDTRAAVPDFASLELDLIRVKGKTVPVRIYTLLGDAGLAQDSAFKAHEAVHARMIEAYRAKRFGETRELLAECRKSALPLSKLYHLYEDRLDAFVAEAPAADWDGTFTATSK
jgi:adenylate cyclase